MGRVAAFFDFDKTIIAGNSQELEARYLVKTGNISFIWLLRLFNVLCARLFYKAGLISYTRYNEIYIRTHKGKEIDAITDFSDTLCEKIIFPLILDDAVNLMDSHREKGHIIIIISATTSHLLQPVADLLSPDRIVCTKLETDPEGVCTGMVEGSVCLGNEKKKAVQRVAEQMDLDLGNSYAYSDHHSDVPFLESVGNPVAINPDVKLNEFALAKGWDVKHLI